MRSKPIVYACSGCSNVARIAHDIALNLDSDGLADMSCVSGVAADIEPIAALAKSGRSIIAIDGCQLNCTKSCLEQSKINIKHQFTLTDLGIEKRDIWDDALLDNSKALTHVYQELKAYGIDF